MIGNNKNNAGFFKTYAPRSEFQKFKCDFFQSKATANDTRLRPEISYVFLKDNIELIDAEIRQLNQTLLLNNQKNAQAQLFLENCVKLSNQFYSAYGKKDKIILSAKRQQAAKKKSAGLKNNNFFVEFINDSFIKPLNYVLASYAHTNSLKNIIGVANAYRIDWIFSRLTTVNFLLLARQQGWLKMLEKLLHQNINIDKIKQIFESPGQVLNVLSVGFFVARLILNLLLITKHTFFPSDLEQQITRAQRFYFELTRRYLDLLNDAVWATVNLLTNYAPVFHIGAVVAGWGIAGFLFFDMCLFLWRLKLAQDDYLAKKNDYYLDLNKFNELKKDDLSLEDKANYADLYLLTEQQLDALEIEWQVKKSTLIFKTAAAILLALGFSATLILTPALFVALGYFVGLIGVAMYLSENEYSNYIEKSLQLNRVMHNNKSMVDKAQTDYQQARQKCVFTLIKNTIVPTIILATFAVYWPAALVLTAAYIGYEVYQAYGKYRLNQQTKLEDCSQVETAGLLSMSC